MQVSRRLLTTISVGFLALATTSCSYLTNDDGMFRDRQGDYLTSPVVAPMQVPAGLDSFTLQEMFPVPAIDSVAGGTFIVPPAPRELDLRVREGVVIQRFGERRWILIGATPGQVWPRLRDFWTTAQLPMALENPIQGTMETEWLDVPEFGREKYRARIEPGLHAGNSEIYVVQVSEAALDVNTPADLMTSHDAERESQMLNAISLYLADRTDLYRASSVSLLAGSIETESKANIVRGSAGELVLELRIDFDRAWGQINQALTSAGVTIVDNDVDQAVINVMFAGAELEESAGFFRRMFSRNNDNEEATGFALQLQGDAETAYRLVAVPTDDLTEETSNRPDELIMVISDNLN